MQNSTETCSLRRAKNPPHAMSSRGTRDDIPRASLRSYSACWRCCRRLNHQCGFRCCCCCCCCRRREMAGWPSGLYGGSIGVATLALNPFPLAPPVPPDPSTATPPSGQSSVTPNRRIMMPSTTASLVCQEFRMVICFCSPCRRGCRECAKEKTVEFDAIVDVLGAHGILEE